jgi:hypothetical protein
MVPFLHRAITSARQRPARGQAMTEYVTLMAALLLTGIGLTSFAPDMMAAFTIYIRGFYLVLGMPIG